MAPSLNPLRDLPTELFDMILKHVAPSPVPTLLPPPTPAQDNTDLVQPEQDCWAAWFDARRDLLNLSRTSIEYRNYCEPLLWRDVAFRSEGKMRSLTMTIYYRPYLGHLIKSIYAAIRGPYDEAPFNMALMYILTTSTPNLEDVLFSQRVDMVSRNLRTSAMLPSAFRHAVEELVSRQVLGLPGTPLPQPLPRLKKFRFRQVRDPLVPSVGYGIDIVPVLPFLPAISTLELWRDSHSTWNHDLGPGDLLAGTEQQEPVITRWPRLNADYPRLPGLKTIRLFGTSANEWQVTDLVLACPALVELVVKFAGTYLIGDGVDAGNELWDLVDSDGGETEGESGNEDEDEEMQDVHSGDDEAGDEMGIPGDVVMGGGLGMGNALVGNDVDGWDGSMMSEDEVVHTVPPFTPLSSAVQRARALRILSITGCGCASYLDRQAPTLGAEPLPRDNWLLPLPLLADLDHLTIDLWGLFGNVPNLEVCDVDLFLERIPPFLTSLTLVMHWDIDQSAEDWPNRDALHVHELMIVTSALSKLAQDESRCLREISPVNSSFDKIRRLRNLSLVHPRLPRNPLARQVFEGVIDNLRSVSLEAGVETFEATEPVDWAACRHGLIGVRYTSRSRRHVARRRAADRFGNEMRDEDWAVFL